MYKTSQMNTIITVERANLDTFRDMKKHVGLNGREISGLKHTVLYNTIVHNSQGRENSPSLHCSVTSSIISWEYGFLLDLGTISKSINHNIFALSVFLMCRLNIS